MVKSKTKYIQNLEKKCIDALANIDELKKFSVKNNPVILLVEHCRDLVCEALKCMIALCLGEFN